LNNKLYIIIYYIQQSISDYLLIIIYAEIIYNIIYIQESIGDNLSERIYIQESIGDNLSERIYITIYKLYTIIYSYFLLKKIYLLRSLGKKSINNYLSVTIYPQ